VSAFNYRATIFINHYFSISHQTYSESSYRYTSKNIIITSNSRFKTIIGAIIIYSRWIINFAVKLNFCKGGNNAPLFFVLKGAQQQPSDATLTKVEFDSEVYDPSGVYDNSTNYRFEPGVAGYYYIFAGVSVTAFGVSLMADAEIMIYKNGSSVVKGRHNASNNYQYWMTPTVQGVVQLGTTDYVEIYAKGDVTTSTPIYFYQSQHSWFGGYKIID
jgi:hypothetical protein